MGTRPLSDLPVVLSRFSGAAQKSVEGTVPKATEALRQIVEANGRRYHIRGRNGRKVPLEARADVKRFGAKPVGRVRGVPAGFWAIVEQGSGPHLIVSRQRRSGGNAAGGFRSNVSAFSDGTLGAGRKPISTPDGPRQFAHHPGHGPIGHPWATSMVEGVQPVVRILSDVSFNAFVKAFTS